MLAKTFRTASRAALTTREAKTAARMFRLDEPKQKVPVLAILPAVLLLACCAGQQHPDLQAKEEKEATGAVTNMTAAMDDAKCQAFGYQPSSPRYFKCRDRFDAERKAVGVTDEVAANPSK
jgi:hypothetical protein